MKTPFLLPRIVFVGDKAELVIPLEGSDFAEGFDYRTIAGWSGEGAADNAGIVIEKLAFELRGKEPYLIVSFTAFAPGELTLSAIETPFLTLEPLSITITSILNGENALVSQPLPPIPVAGFSAFVYTAAGTLLFILVLIAGIRLKGQKWLLLVKKALSKRRSFAVLTGAGEKLKAYAADGTPNDAVRGLLHSVSAELRALIGILTGINCASWTSGEFGVQFNEVVAGIFGAPPLGASAFDSGGACGENERATETFGGELRQLFTTCDSLRFSAARITGADIAPLCALLDRLLARMKGKQ